ncbi:MAG: hypothetical protein JWO51_96 [Rhodospirillales bacterium]|nr:hypothetical protein [Rhodospirillales bacterium]
MANAKPYEFRRWCAPSWMIGERFVVHAGMRKIPAQELVDLMHGELEGSVIDGKLGVALDIIEREWKTRGGLPLGVGLGTAVLGRPRRAIEIMPAGTDPASVDPDCWAWSVSDIEPFPVPIPAKGGRQFWNWAAQS